MKPVTAFIFARGGSKGLPGKNIRLLGGKPLLGWSIDVALQSGYVERVVVSTDDEQIAAVARQCGAEVPFLRPAELASDTAPEWHSWQHACRWLRSEVSEDSDQLFLSLPATAPLRSVADVDACVSLLWDNRSTTDVVVTVSDPHRNPYFNMLTVAEDRTADLVIRRAGRIARRQDAPAVFDQTTVAYASTPEFILSATGIHDGRLKAVHVPLERSIDIDTELDFAIAELLLARRESREASTEADAA